MATFKLDEIDQIILSDLAVDARKPYLEIARECGISGAAIHQRIRKLEENGIITGSRLLIKPSTLDLNVCAFVSVVLSQADKYPEVIKSLKAIPEITECFFVTGKASIMFKLYCHNNEHLMKVLVESIQMIPYVQSTDTMIILDEAFNRQIKTTGYNKGYIKRRKNAKKE